MTKADQSAYDRLERWRAQGGARSYTYHAPYPGGDMHIVEMGDVPTKRGDLYLCMKTGTGKTFASATRAAFDLFDIKNRGKLGQ